jgi:sporulation protein YlmC with PRC-barrel domain
MDVVRDLLDKQIVDRNGRDMGRVDGIVLRVHEDAPPEVTAVEVGPAVLAYRVHPILGRWVAAFEHGFGIAAGRPLRIPLGDVIDIHDHIRVDLAVGETSAATVEQRLGAWIGSIPGSR